jgi:ribonuclease D
MNSADKITGRVRRRREPRRSLETSETTDVLSQLISDNSALSKAISQLSGTPMLAVDTEFMRERTYHAHLCLLQLASEDVAFVIDPLSDVDLTMLSELFYDPSIVKVFHAGSQDMQILDELLGKPVAPVFDTQVAASLLGLPQQMSLAALVKAHTDIELDKSDTYSDWSKRPLRTAQISYALDDVRYLPAIYRQMQSELKAAGRANWLDEEFKALSDPATYHEIPELLWRKIKGNSSLTRRQLGVLQQVTLWREQVAREKDLPRRWVVADEQLLDVAKRSPTNRDELFMTRGLQEKLTRSIATGLLDAVSKGLQMVEKDLPSRGSRPVKVNGFTSAMDLMQTLVHQRANENHIAASILAPNSELQALAAGQREGVSVLNGWRRELIGNELLELLEGSLTLSLKNGLLKVARASEA